MGKDEDQINKDVRDWLTSEEIERTADYIKRGRQFSQLSESELTDRYADTFADAGAYMRSSEVRIECSDCKSEFALRGIEVPTSDRINADFAKIQAAIKEMMAGMSPEAYNDLAAEIDDDLDQFRFKRDHVKKN